MPPIAETARRAIRVAADEAFVAQWERIRTALKTAGYETQALPRFRDDADSRALLRAISGFAEDLTSDHEETRAAAFARTAYRLDRIAVVETAEAMTEAQEEWIRLLWPYRHEPWFAALVKRWDAEIDGSVCDFCLVMNGDIVGPFERFDNDARPGFAHVACRCTQSLFLLPWRLAEIS